MGVLCVAGEGQPDYQIRMIYDAEQEKYMPRVVIGICWRLQRGCNNYHTGTGTLWIGTVLHRFNMGLGIAGGERNFPRLVMIAGLARVKLS